MAIINFGLNKNLSSRELQAILDKVIKSRPRSSSPKRVLDEKQAIEKYFPEGKTTRGGNPFKDAFEAMEKDEQQLYLVWQINLDDTIIDAQDGGLGGILEKLQEDPNVEFAELNQTYRLAWTPNDPELSNLYGLKKIQCERAWNLSRGRGIIVAVVDSGLHVDHVDIARNILRGTDRKIIGFNYVDNNTDLTDHSGHGTHVAGTIAALGNNNEGVIGVAPEAKIMPIKAFAKLKGDSNTLANSIKFAVDHGAHVINNSWAYDSRIPEDTTLRQAIDYALNRGVICVFAAGNNNEKIDTYWIANHPDLIVAASTGLNDQKAPGSNWGPKVTLAAPGHAILSLKAGTLNGIALQNGTSMAAAHVSGAIALYLAYHGKTPVQSIKTKLTASTDLVSGPYALGKGRLNCFKFLS